MFHNKLLVEFNWLFMACWEYQIWPRVSSGWIYSELVNISGRKEIHDKQGRTRSKTNVYNILRKF